MPVTTSFTMESYTSRERERRSSESSTASDATKQRRSSLGAPRHFPVLSPDATEAIPTRRSSVGPKTAANPMQFVAIGPATLHKSAADQIQRAEKLKMAAKPAVKEEEGAAWQNNLDSWKSSRRKRQVDVIERLTEVKRMEEKDAERGRERRNKTFGEMMQERSGKGRSRMLQIYTDDDNDISGLLSSKSPTSSDTKSDLGFATGSDTGSEPSDHQESHEEKSLELCSASPAASEETSSPAAQNGGSEHTNGHDSGTEEHTYDSAIQGYIKFAEKTRAAAQASPVALENGAGGARNTPEPTDPAESAAKMRRETVRRSAKMEERLSAFTSVETRTVSSGEARTVSSDGYQPVVMRDKKPRVDVNKRRSMFEQRSESEERAAAERRRQNRKSADLSDALKHRIASLETVSSGGDPGRVKPAVKDDHFRQKLAMFSSLGSAREAEAEAERRAAVTVDIPRQKSASDLRSRFEQIASEEQRRGADRRPSAPAPLDQAARNRRPSGPGSLERRPASAASSSNSLERRDTRPSSAASSHSSLDRREPRPGSSASSHNSLERRAVSMETAEQPVSRATASQSGAVSMETVQRREQAYNVTETVSRTRDTAQHVCRVETRLQTACSTPAGVSSCSPESARPAVPVPMVRSSLKAAAAASDPPLHAAGPAQTAAQQPTPGQEELDRLKRLSVVEVVEKATVDRPVHLSNMYRLFDQPPSPGSDRELVKEIKPSPAHPTSSDSLAKPEPNPVSPPVVASLPVSSAVPQPYTVTSRPVSQPRAAPAPAPVPSALLQPVVVSPTKPAAATSLSASPPYEDPADIVNKMEAQILRQLEENERARVASDDAPVVLDFTQTSSAPPPTEKPPPPPPLSDEEEQDNEPTTVRPVKSTTAVKKDLYRRRSDFLGIQGAEEEPVPVVARPPDLQAFLRQERAEQERERRRLAAEEQRRRAEQERQEALRRAEQEAEQRSVEWRRRCQEEAELRAQENQRVIQEQERLKQQEQEQQRQQAELYQQQQQEQDQTERRSGPESVTEEWQEEEWRRRREERLTDDDLDRQEREIIESLEREETWRQRQQAKYKTRLAKMQSADAAWPRSQEYPPASSEPRTSDLYHSRHQARSNPNLLQEGEHPPLAQSRSHGDLTRGHVDLSRGHTDQSRSHGDLTRGRMDPGRGQPYQQQRHLPSYTQQQQAPLYQQQQQQLPGPTKPQRTSGPHEQQQQQHQQRVPRAGGTWPQQQQAPSASHQQKATSPQGSGGDLSPSQMSRHTLQALSAAPRSNLRQEWVPRKRPDAPRNTNQHWLIQEAEQRRISEQQERISHQRSATLPAGVPTPYQPPPPPPQHQYPASYNYIQQPIYENTPAQLAANNNNYQDITAFRPNYGTQVYHSPELANHRPGDQVSPTNQSQEERVLSVSGRKKCSHCGEELGRGAAMIIESLRLFYHIDCFKCCVCHVQLGNGSMGADVRVRNNKLHCHDCYSNDEGLKFSKV